MSLWSEMSNADRKMILWAAVVVWTVFISVIVTATTPHDPPTTNPTVQDSTMETDQ